MGNLQSQLSVIEEAVEWREELRHPETKAKYENDMRMRKEEMERRREKREAQLQGFRYWSAQRYEGWSSSEA
jgi:hypothetical protein